MKLHLPAGLALTLGLALPAPALQLEWQPGYEASLRTAAAEKRVVFVALDHEGEARCEHFLKKLARDKQVQALAQGALNVPVSFQTHKKSGKCPRFKGVECTDHRRAGVSLLDSVLQRNDAGLVALPQYLWLDGQGQVLLSVAFEIDRAGLLWCFETARSLVDPEHELALAPEARPPRRLLMGRTFELPPGDDRGRGMTAEELDEVLTEANKSFFGMGNTGLMLRVMFTDEEEAVEYVKVELNGVLKGFARDRIPQTLHTLGNLAPASFWTALEDFADSKSPSERREVAVALEQMGAQGALRLVKKALKREKDERVEPAWVRALGACGPADKGVRKTLLSRSRADEDPLGLRASAVFALGYLERDDEVRALWHELLAGDAPGLAVAAACGAALARDRESLPAVEAALAGAEGPTREALERALAVLRGGDLYPLAGDVARVTEDELGRERIFFSGIPRAPRGSDDGD